MVEAYSLFLLQYKSPTYPYGEAPYPQQPPYQPVAQTDSPGHQQQPQPGYVSAVESYL